MAPHRKPAINHTFDKHKTGQRTVQVDAKNSDDRLLYRKPTANRTHAAALLFLVLFWVANPFRLYSGEELYRRNPFAYSVLSVVCARCTMVSVWFARTPRPITAKFHKTTVGGKKYLAPKQTEENLALDMSALAVRKSTNRKMDRNTNTVLLLLLTLQRQQPQKPSAPDDEQA